MVNYILVASGVVGCLLGSLVGYLAVKWFVPVEVRANWRPPGKPFAPGNVIGIPIEELGAVVGALLLAVTGVGLASLALGPHGLGVTPDDPASVWNLKGRHAQLELDSDGGIISVTLRDTAIRDDDLVLFWGNPFPKLRKLDLSCTGITDVGLRQLKGLRDLQRLIVADTKVTQAGVNELQQALPNLEIDR